METTGSEATDRFSIVIAILIAVVAVVGAIVAWRAAIAADDAGDGDFAGMKATLNVEETRAINNATLYEHYRTYIAYLRHNELGNLLAEDNNDVSAGEASILDHQRAEAWDIATASQSFFPNRYLTREGAYDTQRELGEAWAEAGLQKDLIPEPHFAAADRLRAKSNWLVSILIILAVALVFYTLAEGLNPTLKLIRYGAALGGTVFMLLGIVATVAVELLM